MRVLVTGSEGFVGRHVRAALGLRGLACMGVDRPGSGADIEVDLSARELDVDGLVRAAGPLDAVIYMAATITRGSSVDAAARENLRAIADSPVRIMEALAERGDPPHLVYCSTYKTYGPAEELPIDPMRPPQAPDPHSYGSAKWLAEALLTIAARRSGFRFAIVRPTCIYGPGQHLHNAIPSFLRESWAGRSPVVAGAGSSLRDDVYAPDLAWLLVEAALARVDGAFHAAGERARTIAETAEACCRAVEAAGGPRTEPRFDPAKTPKWWLDQSFDGARSAELLGYSPTTLAAGLEAEARWIESGAEVSRSTEFGVPVPPRAKNTTPREGE